MALLELFDIRFRYEPQSPAVLDGIDLQVDAGQSLSIVGPSGCGKSTLLNIIGTLERPNEGRVVIDGTDTASLDEPALARLRSRRLGFVFQDHHLLPQCSLLENVLVPTLGLPSDERAAREPVARDLLKRVGLGDRVDHRPGEVSGGQRQRAAVVRALVNGPALLLADEPTGSLDADSADALADLLVELNETEKVALITVTHAATLADRMQRTVRLERGHLG